MCCVKEKYTQKLYVNLKKNKYKSNIKFQNKPVYKLNVEYRKKNKKQKKNVTYITRNMIQKINIVKTTTDSFDACLFKYTAYYN